MYQILEFLVFLLVVNFVFKYVVPIVRAVNGVNKRMKQRNETGAGRSANPPSPAGSSPKRSPTPSHSDEEYIEFEEVK